MSWCAFCMWCIDLSTESMRKKKMHRCGKGNQHPTWLSIRCSSSRWRLATKDGSITWAKVNSYTTPSTRLLSNVRKWHSTLSSTIWQGDTMTSTTCLVQSTAGVRIASARWHVRSASNIWLGKSNSSTPRYILRSSWMEETLTTYLPRSQLRLGQFTMIWKPTATQCLNSASSGSTPNSLSRIGYRRCRWTRD